MKLDVPYYSQYKDIKDGNWQRRACGLVCLKMVLDFHFLQKRRGSTSPFLEEFLEMALVREAYHQTNGWVHDKLIEIAQDFGFEAYREEKMEGETELKDFLDKGNPVIVSISAQRFLPEFEGKFHQIVLTGYDENGYFYNDSDYQGNDPKLVVGQEGKDLFVSIEKFRKYWRKMAIFISF